MNSQQIFGTQVVVSFIAYGLMARWYVSPRLARLPLEIALQPLLVLHAFRHLGLVFLVPTVVGHGLPSRFAVPAAYGDLVAGFLALAAMAALRMRASMALPLTWIFNVFGLLDLVNAFYQGLSHDVQLGAAYYIPTFIVPALVVTHLMMLAMLMRRVSRATQLVSFPRRRLEAEPRRAPSSATSRAANPSGCRVEPRALEFRRTDGGRLKEA